MMDDVSTKQAYATLPSSNAESNPSRRRLRTILTAAGVLVSCVAAVSVVAALYANDRPLNTVSRPVMRETDNGVVVKVLNGDSMVELAVAGLSAFRVSVAFTGNAPVTINNPMVAPQSQQASYTMFHQGSDVVGIKTSYGSISINATSGAFVMADSNGDAITTSNLLATSQVSLKKGDTCAKSWENYDVPGNTRRTPGAPNGLKVADQTACCTACNNDNDCTTWVYAAPGHESNNINCWLLMGTNIAIHEATYRTVGGAIQAPPAETIVTFTKKSSSSKFYGSGCGSGNARSLAQTQAASKVTNTEFYSPHYFTTDGYAALVASPNDFRDSSIFEYPVQWDATAADHVTWTVTGSTVDVYLIPADTQADALSRYWDLTGRPVVPPRHAFGFTASRWGWTDYNYVTNMLGQFRSGNYPIDSWISDFEWYTPEPDYSLPESGSPTFQDFTYNPVLFPNPVQNLATYHNDFHLRFGGIRKPRLGNSDLLIMAHNKNWTVDASHAGGAPGGTRNLNYSVADLRTWYQQQTAHFLQDGVDFYWNDEGETFYFAFFWWNQAQLDGLKAFDSKRRFYTINRSYTPGLQRLGATVWTGDVQVSWDALKEQPGYLANWGLAGAPYLTCDTGGFNGDNTDPLLLTRWYFVSAFLPIMRVHSSLNNVPHFPFLYPEDAANGMRKALNLRYELVPYHYSLAHHMYQPEGRPVFRPMLLQYNTDPAVQEMTAQWMDGASVLVCPVMDQSNSTSCYLPQGLWYEYRSAVTHQGDQTLSLNNVALDTIPLFVTAGAIVPSAGVVQYTDMLPGGPLQLQVYGGTDATFTMVEDDGETYDYQLGNVRATTYTWSDSAKTLSWTVSGSFSDSHTFTQVQVFAYFSDGTSKTSPVLTLGTSGRYSF